MTMPPRGAAYMSEFLEKLKIGMQEAQQVFTVAQQKFTATQTESQAIAQKLAVAQTELRTGGSRVSSFPDTSCCPDPKRAIWPQVRF